MRNFNLSNSCGLRTYLPLSLRRREVLYALNQHKLKLCYAMGNQEGTPVAEARSEHCFLSREGKILNLKKAAPEIFQAICRYTRE